MHVKMNDRSPRLTVDGLVSKNNKILLIKRKNEPFRDKWALPGGFVEYGEKVEDAVVREVFEETGLRTEITSLFGIYSDPGRDPRGHTISAVFILKILGGEVAGGDDASDANFFSFDDLPVLGFDHDKIVDDFKKEVL